MNARLCGVAVAALAGITLTACSSGHHAAPTPSNAASNTSTTSNTNSNGPAPGAAALAARIRAGLRGLSSARIVADAGALGGTVSGEFRYVNGTASASDLQLGGAGSGHGEIVTVGARSWVEPPVGQRPAGKPWVLVRPGSSNAFVRGVSPVLTVAKAAGSLPAIADVVATASAVTDKGTTSVDGGPAHEYAVVVDPATASASALTGLLRELGATAIPITLDLDRSGRPVHVTVTVPFGGASYRFTVAVSDFDAPVRISPPPAGQVSEQ